MITYRKATIEDIPQILPQFEENIRKFFKHEYSPKVINYFFEKRMTPARLEEMLATGGSFYLAEDDDQPVGFLLVIEKEMGGVSFANWFAVNEDHQKQGIGSGLLKTWEEDMLARGVHALMIGTEEYNIDFYKKRGFNYIGLMPKGYWGADDHYMYKTIQEPNDEMSTKE